MRSLPRKVVSLSWPVALAALLPVACVTIYPHTSRLELQEQILLPGEDHPDRH